MLYAKSWANPYNQDKELWDYSADDVPKKEREKIFEMAVNVVFTHPLASRTNLAEHSGFGVEIYTDSYGSHLSLSDATIESPERFRSYSKLIAEINKLLPADKQIPLDAGSNTALPRRP